MSQRNDDAAPADSKDPIGTVLIVPADGRRFAAELLDLQAAGITLRVTARLMLFGEQFVVELENRRALYLVARCELTKDFRWLVEGAFQCNIAEEHQPDNIDSLRKAVLGDAPKPPQAETPKPT